MNKEYRGFTLIELLIVIAVLAILAAAVFVALNPLKRFQDSRDSNRASSVNELLSAVKVQQTDNGGSYMAAVSSLTAGSVYMIGTATTSCNQTCATPVASATSCVDLTPLVTAGYMGSLPVSPSGATTWTAGLTGYTITRASSGTLTIRACEHEGTSEISSSR